MYFTILFLQKMFELYTCKEPLRKKGSKDEKKRELECLVGAMFVFSHDKLKKRLVSTEIIHIHVF